MKNQNTSTGVLAHFPNVMERKKKIYIAGKITGMIAEARLRFHLAEEILKEKGYTVVNPINLPHQHDLEWESFMKECIKALCDCDAIYMLSNWRQSRGAMIEEQLAIELKLEIIYQ